MNKIKIVEALCGCGKSYWAIEMMKSNPKKRWLFITPFLDEAGDDDTKRVGRIRDQAPTLNFHTPSSNKTNKIKDLLRLLRSGVNISCTHNLFLNITKEHVTEIEKYGYNLVIDETIEKVELLEGSQDKFEDIHSLIEEEMIVVQEDGLLKWNGKKLNAYEYEYELCEKGILYLYENKIFIKRHSSKCYEKAKEVYILTYMFHASPMRVWLQANNISWEYLTPDLRITTANRKQKIRHLIHIEPAEKDLIRVNSNRQTEYSSNWFKRQDYDTLSLLSRVASRLYKRWQWRYKRAPKIMYTCFKNYANEVAGIGSRGVYSHPDSNFVAKNARATNEHADKDCIIYWVNVYPHMSVKQYLDGLIEEDGLDSDQYALSEMIQFVFRSALREGKPIDIFIASDRMRGLFKEWLDHDN